MCSALMRKETILGWCKYILAFDLQQCCVPLDFATIFTVDR